MKQHRFFIGSEDLAQHLRLNDENIYLQWSKVLRFDIGREVVLFNNGAGFPDRKVAG